MGYVRRAGTTAKVPITDDLKKEIELVYLHGIVNIIEKYNIPPSLVLNLDQTPSKFVPGSRSTLAKKKVQPMITLTFAVTLNGTFLPMHIIYGGKTKKCLPRGVKFPSTFSLSYNPKHYSNEKKVLKYLDEIIIPYIDGERERLGLPNQIALLIMDIFKGQKTDAVPRSRKCAILRCSSRKARIFSRKVQAFICKIIFYCIPKKPPNLAHRSKRENFLRLGCSVHKT